MASVTARPRATCSAGNRDSQIENTDMRPPLVTPLHSAAAESDSDHAYWAVATRPSTPCLRTKGPSEGTELARQIIGFAPSGHTFRPLKRGSARRGGALGVSALMAIHGRSPLSGHVKVLGSGLASALGR